MATSPQSTLIHRLHSEIGNRPGRRPEDGQLGLAERALTVSTQGKEALKREGCFRETWWEAAMAKGDVMTYYEDGTWKSRRR
jgi:hypothetical protein